MMRDLFIVKTDLDDFKKIKILYKFYKSLAVDILSIPISRLDEDIVSKIIDLNSFYKSKGMGIGLRFELLEIIGSLIGDDDFSLKDPRIRKSFYQFLSFLIKRGLGVFEIEGFKAFKNSGLGPSKLTLELYKNSSFSDTSLAYTSLDGENFDLLARLASKNFKSLDMIRPRDDFKSLTDYKDKLRRLLKTFEKNNSGLILSSDFFYKDSLNFTNYKTFGRRLVFLNLFFLKGASYLEEKDLIREDLDFIKKLGMIGKTHPFLAMGDIREIIPKDPDILAYIRQYDGKKLLVLSNFKEKEVLVDLSYVVMDYRDYSFLIGTYTKRRMVKNILLRPFEALAFTKVKEV